MAMTGGTARLVAKGTPSGWPGPISLYVYYKVGTQDMLGNKTELSLGMYLTTPSGWFFGPWQDGYGSYVGTAPSGADCKTFNGTCPANTQGTRWLTENQQVTVTHEDDGTKKATIYWQWGASSSWAGFSAPASGSFSLELPTIPRASIMDSLSCATGYLTGNLTYKYTPKSSAYYNKCDISLNVEGTHTTVKSINIGKKSAAQQTGTVTLSEAELATIYQKLPSANKGTLRFTLRTYSDSGYSKPVGSEGYKEITLSIPDDPTTKAEVSMNLAPVSSLPEAFAGLYIQGKTRVKAELSAEGKYGAGVRELGMKVEGGTYDSGDDYISGYLPNYGSITVEGFARDSRGFTGSTSREIKVIPYAKPKILGAVAARCDANGVIADNGTYLKIIAERSYSPVKSGEEQKNFCQIRYRYKTVSAQSYSQWFSLLDREDLSADRVETAALQGGTFAVSTTYLVQIQAIDDIGESAETEIYVPTDIVHNHKTKNGWGFGKYCEGENLMDVAWDAHFHGDVFIGEEGMTLKEYILAVINEGG